MERLIELFGTERALGPEVIPESYLVDAVTGRKGSAYGLVFPLTTEDVVTLVVYAKMADLSLIARGAGTGLTGATLPVRSELLVDFSRMNRIIGLDTETLTLRVQPGVTLAAVQDYVASHGFFYPPDPGSKEATIGGTVATNAGGMRAVKYGVTRDYVRQLEVVLLSGEILPLGSLTEKNSSGYDLRDLFIGSEGTLGFITEIDLRVIVPPEASQSVLIAFDGLESLSKTVSGILTSQVEPTALEFFEKDGIGFSEKDLGIPLPLDSGSAYLLLTLDGEEEMLGKRITEVVAIAEANDSLESLVLSQANAAQVWQLRGHIVAAIEAVSQQEPLDVVVPLNKITETIQFIKALGIRFDLPTICFGHAGDGNIHACIMRQQLGDEWEERLDQFLSELYRYIAIQRGLPSAEHGIGLLKKPYFIKEVNPVYLKYLEQIKEVFDPDNRLNPTKMF